MKFESMLVAVERSQIVSFKSIIESYDNLATLRTEDSRKNLLRLYFSPESRKEIDALLRLLIEKYSISVVS